MVLRNILIAALREMEVFRPETAWPDDKDGFFEALKMLKQEQRQR